MKYKVSLCAETLLSPQGLQRYSFQNELLNQAGTGEALTGCLKNQKLLVQLVVSFLQELMGML